MSLMCTKLSPNTCFNLINPLAWFVQNNNAQTMPSPRNSSGADLMVKPMLEEAFGQNIKPIVEASDDQQLLVFA